MKMNGYRLDKITTWRYKMSNYIWIFAILTGHGVHAVNFTAIKGPLHQAVPLSDYTVTFTCNIQQSPNSSSYVGWEKYIKEDGFSYNVRLFNDLTYVYVPREGNDTLRPRYNVSNPSPGQYDLSISPLSMAEDTGSYRCVALNLPDLWSSAELILLESDPVCTTNVLNNQAIAGDWVNYSCAVTYKGRWAPVMKWGEKKIWHNVKDETESGEIPAVKNETVTAVKNESSDAITVTYTMTWQVSNHDDNYMYSYKTYFEKPEDLRPSEQINTPQYKYTSYFNPLTVTTNSASTAHSNTAKQTLAYCLLAMLILFVTANGMCSTL